MLSAEFRYLVSALLAALALHFAARGGTPIDAAMPFVGVAIVFLAFVARCEAIEACVPLLVAAAIALPEERMRLFAYGINPYLLTRPYVGFSPTSEQKLAGHLMEPPVSEPRATEAMPAETAAALPPDDPPGTLPASQGFKVSPKAEFPVVFPIPNSSRFVLPITIPSSLSMRRMPARSGSM